VKSAQVSHKNWNMQIAFCEKLKSCEIILEHKYRSFRLVPPIPQFGPLKECFSNPTRCVNWFPILAHKNEKEDNIM
jgi:hypothetical protein